MKSVSKLKQKLTFRVPFFASAITALEVEVIDGCEHDCTIDGKVLKFSKAFFDAATQDKVMEFMAKASLQVLLGHVVRMGGRNKKVWNEASTIVVDNELCKIFHTTPTPKYFNMSAEQVYADLSKDKPQDNGDRSGNRPGDQSGNQPGASGPVILEAAPDAPNAAALREATAAMADQSEKSSGCGKTLLDSLTRANAEQGHVDLAAHLERIIGQSVSELPDYNRPNRRLTDYSANSGIMFPGRRKNKANRIGLAIDTSGSLDKVALGRALGIMQHVAATHGIDEIVVVQCDNQIHEIETYNFVTDNIDDMDFKGRGGTSFAPVMGIADDLDVPILFYFTDLMCSDYGKQPEVPVVWLLQGYEEQYKNYYNPPFGELLVVDKD